MAYTPNLRTLFIPLFLLAMGAGCHNYYMATTKKKDPAVIDSLNTAKRDFILRNGNKAYYMKMGAMSEDHKTVQVTLDSLSFIHQVYVNNGPKQNLKYKKSTQEGVLNEVHFYIPYDSTIQVPSSYTLALDKVQKIEVIEKDKKRTTNSWVIGTIGYTLGAMAVAIIIIAATKSSCPFVSADDGNSFSLQGEIYGGAIYPQLARHDYLPLKLAPSADGTYRIKISNELKEIQYTDMAELWVIAHQPTTKVLPGADGELYSISNPQQPLEATFRLGNDALKNISAANDLRLFYFDDTVSRDGVNQMTATFEKPAQAQKAKLLLTLKNSYFLDYLYGELAKGFGKYYATYIRKQHKKTAGELLKWVSEQKIPLEIAIKTTEGWKKVQELTTIGPLTTREVVVPLDLSAVSSQQLQVRLSSGFMFWEIDAMAIDYSNNTDYTIEKPPLSQATDETGKDIRTLLNKEDGQYLEQPEIGNVATLEYKAGRHKEDMVYSYVFHTKGYYQHIRNFTGKADVKFLKQFTKPNAFPLYGMERYKQQHQSNPMLFASN
jgi:hypothetical protein